MNPMLSVLVFLLYIFHFGTIVDCFLLSPTSDGPSVNFESTNRPTTTVFQMSAMTDPTTEKALRNEPLSAPSPRQFDWWNDACDTYLDELDRAGGERFVASHDEPDDSGKTDTKNWLHVTSSNPSRRVQYEVRYVGETQTMGGVVRFGTDCEGPENCAHGGSIASVADALTATCCFKASERWGMTTRLECNYREAVPIDTPVRIEATVTDLKKRKASLEWSIHSLTKVDRSENPVRHAFGSADFLLPRPAKE